MNRRSLFICAALILSTCGLTSACPMCKDSIPNGEASTAAQAGSLPSGFNYSVYYMLSGLFITLGLISTVVYKGIRSTNVEIDPRLLSRPRGFDVKPGDPTERD
jgi:hypothetical protein